MQVGLSLSQLGSTFKAKILVLWEQILSFISRSHFGRAFLSVIANRQSRKIMAVKMEMYPCI